MPTIATRLLGAFSFLAILLASLGLYGVVSFSVSRRSPEMGIRIAMGAERTQLIQMVMREMLLTVTVGLAMGVGFALLTAPALGPVLYQVPAVDIASFVFGAVLVTLGIFAVMSPLFSGIATAVLVGLLLFTGGIIETIFAFKAPSFGKGVLVFLFGGLAIAAGMLTLMRPGEGLGAMTIILPPTPMP